MKTLILKPECNAFEHFISECIRAEGIEAAEPFNVPKLHKEKYRFFIFEHLHAWRLYATFLNEWAASIAEYDVVIVFDYGLKKSLLEWIRWANPKIRIIVWLWNVFEGYPFKKLQPADCVFCFDKTYAEEHGLRYAPQFHFPRVFEDKVQGPEGNIEQVDVSFVGYNKQRKARLREIASIVESQGLTYSFTLVDPSEVSDSYSEANGSIKITRDYMPYSDVLERACYSNALLDLCKRGQAGLTLRALEALYGQKKLITDNASIKQSGFYNENNVFIIGEDKWSDLGEFIRRPYCPVPKEAEDNHSFSNWLSELTANRSRPLDGNK